MNFSIYDKYSAVEVIKLCVADEKMLTTSLNSSRT